jgi:hypothetical protein
MTHLSVPARYNVVPLGRLHTQPVFTLPAA